MSNMLPGPRSSKKSKRSSKRAVSAPQKGLLQMEADKVANPLETIDTKPDPMQMSSGSDEILDLFEV